MRALRVSRSRSLCCLAVLAFGLGATRAAAESVYDAAVDFSPTKNPTDEGWSYGWSESLGSQFFLATSPTVVEGLDSWLRDYGGTPGLPGILHNGTNQDLYWSQAFFDEGQLALHPGGGGEYAVLRWTAPDNGAIVLTASFLGIDYSGPTTTDAHVL